MTITCPKCGFTGGFAAEIPSDQARAKGAVSKPMDLLDSGKYVDFQIGELSVCSNCEAALVYAGWMEIDPGLMLSLDPKGRKMIRDAQAAIRRAKQDPDWKTKGNKP